VKNAQQRNRAYSNNERNKILKIPDWCRWWNEQDDEISQKNRAQMSIQTTAQSNQEL